MKCNLLSEGLNQVLVWRSIRTSSYLYNNHYLSPNPHFRCLRMQHLRKYQTQPRSISERVPPTKIRLIEFGYKKIVFLLYLICNRSLDFRHPANQKTLRHGTNPPTYESARNFSSTRLDPTWSTWWLPPMHECIYI